MTPSTRPHQADLARLRSMAFSRQKGCTEVLGELWSLREKIDAHLYSAEIWRVYDWMLCPLTLWAVDYPGLAGHLVAVLRSGKPFDSDLALLLHLLEAPPSSATQSGIGLYESTVSKGRYDSLLKQPEKFAETEAKLSQDAELLELWRLVKRRFKRELAVIKAPVVRRTLSRERNFEPHLPFVWRSKGRRFQVLVDALCYRWKLYGFEGDKPLLLKISVNPTPHGTMILIPRHWSFDRARDLDWKAISKIHKAHGTTRQGPKLSSARLQRQTEKEAANALCQKAKALGLRGQAAHDYVLRGMNKHPGTDRSWLKRLRKG